jgi:hypothetical protein
MSSALGAGNGADMLQQILRQKFTEAIAQQNQQQNQQRIALDAQRLQQQQQYQNEQLKSLQEARAAAGKAQATSTALRIASALKPGSTIDAGTVGALQGGDMGDLVQHHDATLGSTNLSGAAQVGATAPRILGLAASANPGQAARDEFTGTASQLQGEEDRKTRAEQIAQARQDRIDAAAQAQQAREDMVRLAASLKPPPQTHARYDVKQGKVGDADVLIRTNLDTGAADVIPVPTGATVTHKPAPHVKTPDEIEAESKARAKGTAAGKAEAGGGGLLDMAAEFFRGGGGKAPSGVIRARDPQGRLHEAPAGTALPSGWVQEK